LAAGTTRLSRPRGAVGSLLALICLLCLGAAFAPAMASAAGGEGALEGTVVDSVTTAPLEGVEVCATQEGGSGGGCMSTTSAGQFRLELPEGEYEVELTFAGYATKYLFHVEVLEGQTTFENVSLEEVGGIEGVVTNSQGGGITETLVCLDGTGGLYFGGCQFTDPIGEYFFEEIPPGEYEVEFTGLQCEEGGCEVEECEQLEGCARPFVPQVYDNVPIFHIGESTLIPVAAGETVEGIDAELLPGGKIEGRVTLARTGAPLAGIKVSASPVRVNARNQSATTDANGEYTIEGLAEIEFFVRFEEECEEPEGTEPPECPRTYFTQWYGDVAEEETSTPVEVSAAAPRTGIDAAMVEINPPQAPAFTAGPTLGGTAAVGSTLTCSPGTWTNDPTSVTYAWQRGGAAIAGQAGGTYLVTSTDQGASLTCVVTIANEAGSVSATSNAITIPVPIGGTGSGTTTSTGSGSTKTSTPKAKPATGPSTATAKGGTVTLTLKCGGEVACKGSLKLVYEEKTKKNGKTTVKKITVGSASFQVAAGKSKATKVKLTGQGKALLAEAGKKGLKVKLGGSGIKARTLTLKASSD
jgi:hypothetical protein